MIALRHPMRGIFMERSVEILWKRVLSARCPGGDIHMVFCSFPGGKRLPEKIVRYYADTHHVVVCAKGTY